MDDVLLIYAKSAEWDHDAFLADFVKSEVYHAPLTLEDGTPGTFLETTFADDGKGPVRFWLKNDNKEGEEPKVWRYMDFRSHGPYMQKRALITSMMRKVHKMTSDPAARSPSAIQKLAEFRRLHYPRGLITGVCSFMGAVTGDNTWIRTRELVQHHWYSTTSTSTRM